MTTINTTSAAASQTALLQSAQNKTQAAVEQVQSAISDKDRKKIEAAATDFEAMFLTEMMRPMFDTVKTDPMFGGGKGEDTFKGFLLQEYGKKMSENGGIGLASFVKDEMIRIQEAVNK